MCVTVLVNGNITNKSRMQICSPHFPWKIPCKNFDFCVKFKNCHGLLLEGDIVEPSADMDKQLNLSRSGPEL